jgi:hypothetical protein
MHWMRRLLQKVYDQSHDRPTVARVRLVLQRLEADYRRERERGLAELLESDLRSRRVLSGPFQGLLYANDISLGSSFYPKLVGTYEKEIGTHLERLLRTRDYATIVDVGSAEGFYAVGLALRCPRATIYAYDIDPAARGCLAEMARANGVLDRIEFGTACTPEVLAEHAERSSRGLVVSDCEGYELELFRSDVLEKLRGWDLIIETHDSLETPITDPLARRLGATHRTRVVHWRRWRLEDYPGSDASGALGRLAAMDEDRTWRNKWLYCESRA